ncbi:hypothetical protein J4430_02425 [Candidatus Woesearchaeota archaeon]|nr:hypothetical protein [Candidatus Woesearchaeota archaeon]
MVKNSQKEKKETLRKAPSKEKLINDLIENNHILQEKATEVVLAINKLTKKLDTMIDLFEEAAKNIRSDMDEPLAKRLNELLDQNKNIARGLLLLEKYVKENSSSGFPPRPIPRSSPF